MKRIIAPLLVASQLVLGIFYFGAPALAAREAYDASVISFSAPQTLAPGSSGTVAVTFRNIGSATWVKSGNAFLSLYAYDPVKKVETSSVFASPDWNSTVRASALGPVTVNPDTETSMNFSVKAPSKPGTYTGNFILVAENTRRIKNSLLTVSITVSNIVTASTPTLTVSTPTPAVPEAPVAIPASSEWAAELVSPTITSWQLEMEQGMKLMFTFKNTGTKTWERDSANYVSLYATQGAKERTSVFKEASWLSSSQAVKLMEVNVKPGETGHFEVPLKAPYAPGSFKEEFALAAEKKAWISGSTVTLPIKVPTNDQYVSKLPTTSDVAIVTGNQTVISNKSYAAALLLRSVTQLSLLGNGSQEITVGYKNTGTATWNARSLRVSGVTPAVAGKVPTVRDESWSSSVEPVIVNGQTKPGEIGFLTFKVKAPAKKGSYTVRFALHADNQPVEGGSIEIPITVTADGYIAPEPISIPVTTPKPTVTTPNQNLTASPTPSIDAIPLNGDASALPAEPIIRVGLMKPTDDSMVVKAYKSGVNVTSGGSAVCSFPLGQSVTVHFDRGSKRYSINGAGCSGSSSSWYVLRSDDGLSPMEITDWSRPVSWLPGANDNKFRTQLELRYTPKTDAVWIINELLFEQYLHGIGETSNSSPQEYQRALLTAARTYGYYHIQRGTKHGDEFYIVDGTYDQVYKGYGSEARSPNIVAGVDATRGQIVTYKGKLAITPYYSRSDGRTRTWNEVWAGNGYPWLVSVPVPWDQGKTLWGHGVGMSATGALGMAADGYTYDKILYHFYTGVELRKAYK